jgi:hypothetical protein
MPTTSTIIQSLASPPIGLLHSNLDPNNPYIELAHTLVTPVGLLQAYGLTWEVVTSREGAGFSNGIMREWEDRILQAVVFHNLAPLGGTVATQVVDSQQDSGMFIFAYPAPAEVEVYIAPGFALNFSWLGILP